MPVWVRPIPRVRAASPPASGNLAGPGEQEFQRGMSRAFSVLMQSQPLETHEFERWAGVAMATAVVAYGLSRRSLPGVALAAAAAPLAYRGVTGQWPGMSNGTPDTRVAL